jgi:deoxycytidine triphosphate deaminase
MRDQQFSLLSGEEIKGHGLVINGQDDLYRAATYDLSVGEIILANPNPLSISVESGYALPPGGTVRVVSRESLQLPRNITGHVLLRNGLCRTGVLAINIGVVDPGYSGPLSSTLINFGRADFIVRRGLPFLRVSFHRCPESPKADDSKKWDQEKYLDHAKEEVLAYSAATFLNIEETAAKAADTAFGSFKQALLIWATLAAVVLTLITILAPIGASYVDRYLAGRDRREAETYESVEKKLEERYGARLKDLADQIDELRRSQSAKGVKQGLPSRRQ